MESWAVQRVEEQNVHPSFSFQQFGGEHDSAAVEGLSKCVKVCREGVPAVRSGVFPHHMSGSSGSKLVSTRKDCFGFLAD